MLFRKSVFICFLIGTIGTLICMLILLSRRRPLFSVKIMTVSSKSSQFSPNGALTGHQISGLSRRIQILPKKPETVCPELENIPNLVNNREMDLSTTVDMGEVEKVVFDNRLQQIRDSVLVGNKLITDRKLSTYDSNNQTPERLSALGVQHRDYVYLPGGHYRPANCQSRWKVAIIIPFRNRTAQLTTFLLYMVPFLQKQLLEFGIFVVNQENVLLFNRGMLMNTGFLESQPFSNWDCYIFHDVDHIPQSELNPYGCTNMPRPFITGADNRNYRLPYAGHFGGVIGFKSAQFRQINGFSNAYWGWCCEDDDLGQRVNAALLRTYRNRGQTGYYKANTNNHIRSAGQSAGQRENRANLGKSHSRFRTDGLNSIRYSTPHIELHTLYTNVSVDIRRLKLS